MKTWLLVATATVLIGTLSGCGGGSNGGGGALPIAAGGPGAPTSPPADPPSTPPLLAPAPTITLTVNGAAAAVDAAAVAVKPGDTVVVAASPNASWTAEAAEAGAVTLLNSSVTGARWSARLVNERKSEQTYYLRVTAAAGGSETRTIALTLAAADARNDTYRVFGGTGLELKLALNFDVMSFTFTQPGGGPAGGLSRAGTFEADAAEPGSFIFKDPSTATLPSNNTRFRLAADTVVGGYMLPVPNVNLLSMYAPFIAVRSVVTTQAELSGVYNRIDMTLTPGPVNMPSSLSSKVRQVQVTAGGGELLMCDETNTISRIDSCAGAILRYAAGPMSADGTWTFTNIANAADKQVLTVARVGGDKVMLHAGSDGALLPTYAFRIGLPEATAWQDITARGADRMGGWGRFSFTGATFTGTATVFNGSTRTSSFALLNPGASAPRSLRLVNETPGVFFALQSPKLLAMVGGDGTTSGWYGGYLQLGLVD